MNKTKFYTISTVVSVIFMFASAFSSAAINPKRSWGDSYSVGGKCYCATTYDHGIGNYTVNTPAGSKTVREVCNKIGGGPGKGNNPLYNTVQCGHEPGHNDASVRDSNGKLIRDEKVCPGRVDQGDSGCQKKGPKWDLSVFNGNGDNGDNGDGSGTFKCSNNNNNSQECKSATGKNGAWCNVWNNGKPKNVCHCGGQGVCKGNTAPSTGGDTFSCDNNNNNAQQCKSATGVNDSWCNIWNNGKPKNVCHCGGRGVCKK